MSGTWSVYILRCGDDSLYTGITTDVSRRIREHESGRVGAKYLRGRGPYRLEHAQLVGDRSAASRAEYRVKKLLKSDKERLLRDRPALRARISELALRS